MADRYTIISSDCHAGGNHAQYREYLDADLRDTFDAWRGKYSNPFRDLQDDGRSRNWDDERRNGDLDAEELQPPYKNFRYDLCAECHKKFVRDPLSKETSQKFHFSEN